MEIGNQKEKSEHAKLEKEGKLIANGVPVTVSDYEKHYTEMEKKDTEMEKKDDDEEPPMLEEVSDE